MNRNLCGLKRKCDTNGRASMELTGEGELAAMGFGDRTADGQPQAGSAAGPAGPRSRRIDTVEPLADVRQVLRSDPLAVIRDFDDDLHGAPRLDPHLLGQGP